MNVIVDAGNPSYFETRAIEFVSEAAVTRAQSRNFSLGPETHEAMVDKCINQYKEELENAIKMLVIAILKVEDGET